jgi:hypothetical protein
VCVCALVDACVCVLLLMCAFIDALLPVPPW